MDTVEKHGQQRVAKIPLNGKEALKVINNRGALFQAVADPDSNFRIRAKGVWDVSLCLCVLFMS